MSSQTFNYDKKWAEVQTNEQNGAFKSNLTLVNEILKQAKKDNKKDHVIKALLYQSNIYLKTKEEKEEPEVDIVNNFENEIKSFKRLR